MRICLDIEFSGQEVVILGGGNVALRKASQYLAAGARVCIFSVHYLPAFDDLPVVRVSREELSRHLKHARLAIACTDSPEANRAFLEEAESFHVLSMCAMKDTGQNTYSMTEIRSGSVTAAFSTGGAFPLACRELVQSAGMRIQLLGTIRDSLHDRSLCRTLTEAGLPLLQFLCRALSKRQALVFLMHGSSGALACDEAEKLAKTAEQTFPSVACGWLFTGRNHRTIDVGSLLRLLRDLGIRSTFCPLFWEDGSYASEAAEAVRLGGFQMADVRITPDILLEEGETPLLHTRGIPGSSSILISLLYSPWLRAAYPSMKYRVFLEDPRAEDDIMKQLKGFEL